MAKTARIKSSPQKWRAWGLIISGLTGKNTEILLVGGHWRGVYNRQSIFEFLNNLVNLFTSKNWIKLGPPLPREKWPKLSAYFSGYRYPKLSFSIITNQLVRFGLISVESVSLKALVGYHFPLLIGILSPHHTCSISKEEEEEEEGWKVGAIRIVIGRKWWW